MYKTPTPHEDHVMESIGEPYSQQGRFASMTSPSFLSNGGSTRPKPRLFISPTSNSISPTSTLETNARVQFGEIDLRSDRDRVLQSSNRSVETRVRREIEESQALLLTKSHNIEETSNREIVSLKERFESQIMEKEFQWEKKMSEAENEHEKKIVKLMNDSFDQKQQALKDAHVEKEMMSKLFQAQQVSDKNMIAELLKQIKKLEKSSSFTLKTYAEQEMENKSYFEISKKEIDDLRNAYDLKEMNLKAEMNEKNEMIADMQRQEKEEAIAREGSFRVQLIEVTSRYEERQTVLVNDIQVLLGSKNKSEKTASDFKEKNLLLQGEVSTLSEYNKNLIEKLSEQNTKLLKEEENSKGWEKKCICLEENLKNYRKVMFEKELADRKQISDLRKSLNAATEVIKLNEMNKKVEKEKKEYEVSELEQSITETREECGEIYDKKIDEITRQYEEKEIILENNIRDILVERDDLKLSEETVKSTNKILQKENSVMLGEIKELKIAKIGVMERLEVAKREINDLQLSELEKSLNSNIIEDNKLFEEFRETKYKIGVLIEEKSFLEKSLDLANNSKNWSEKKLHEKEIKLISMQKLLLENEEKFRNFIVNDQRKSNDLGGEGEESSENNSEEYSFNSNKSDSNIIKKNKKIADKLINSANLHDDSFYEHVGGAQMSGSKKKNNHNSDINYEKEINNIPKKIHEFENINEIAKQSPSRTLSGDTYSDRRDSLDKFEISQNMDFYTKNNISINKKEIKEYFSNSVDSKNSRKKIPSNLAHQSEPQFFENTESFESVLITKMKEKENEMYQSIQKIQNKKNKIKYIAKSKEILFVEKIECMMKKIKHLKEKVSDRKYWKKVAVCVAEAAIHTCAGAVTVPEIKKDKDSEFILSQGIYSYEDEIFPPLSADNRIVQYLKNNTFRGNVLVNKDMLATVLTMSKGIIERSL